MQSFKLASAANIALDGLLQNAVTRHDLPSVVAVVANRESVLYRGAFGASVTDIYQIASMTKPVTSVSIMMLKERGRIDLDDPVERYLPAYAGREVILAFDAATAAFTARPAAGPITIRHLLTHTSGVGYDFCNETLLALCKDGKQSPFTLPILHDPGSRWTYGCSTTILGEVIDQIIGEPFYRFQEREIFQPLGMLDTGYFLKPADEDRLAPLHRRVDRDWVREPKEQPYKSSLSADGGMIGTADDYIRFLQMLLNMGKLGDTRLLTAQSVSAMISNQIGHLTVETQPGAKANLSCAFPLGAGKDKFGLGFQLKVGVDDNARSPGSYSWGGIFNTHFWADPQKGIAVILFTQLLPFYDDQVIRLLRDFEHCIYKNLEAEGK